MVNSCIVPWLIRASSSRNKMELFTTYSWSLVAADQLVCGSRVYNDTLMSEWHFQYKSPITKARRLKIHELKMRKNCVGVSIKQL